LRVGEVERGEHGRTALAAGHQPDIGNPGSGGGGEHRLLVTAVGGDHNRGEVGG
jgi:hypothetical protein